jgi:hypothetical protein
MRRESLVQIAHDHERSVPLGQSLYSPKLQSASQNQQSVMEVPPTMQFSNRGQMTAPSHEDFILKLKNDRTEFQRLLGNANMRVSSYHMSNAHPSIIEEETKLVAAY